MPQSTGTTRATQGLRPVLVAQDGRWIPLVDAALLGSAETCHILLLAPGVAAEHCRCERTPHGWILRDLNSTPATYVNGKTIGQAPLTPGDVIQIGTIRFQVLYVNPAREADPSRAAWLHTLECMENRAAASADLPLTLRETAAVNAQLAKEQTQNEPAQTRVEETEQWAAELASQLSLLDSRRSALEQQRKKDDVARRRAWDEIHQKQSQMEIAQQKYDEQQSHRVREEERLTAARQLLQRESRDLNAARREWQQEHLQIQRQLAQRHADLAEREETLHTQQAECTRTAEHWENAKQGLSDDLELRRRELAALDQQIAARRSELLSLRREEGTPITASNEDKQADRTSWNDHHSPELSAVENQLAAMEELVAKLESYCQQLEQMTEGMDQSDKRLILEYRSQRDTARRLARVREELEQDAASQRLVQEKRAAEVVRQQLSREQQQLRDAQSRFEARRVRLEIERRNWDRKRLQVEQDLNLKQQSLADERQSYEDWCRAQSGELDQRRAEVERERQIVSIARWHLSRHQASIDLATTQLQLERRRVLEQRILLQRLTKSQASSESQAPLSRLEAKLRREEDAIRRRLVDKHKRLDDAIKSYETERSNLARSRQLPEFSDRERAMEQELDRYRAAHFRSHALFAKTAANWERQRRQYERSLSDLSEQIENLTAAMLNEGDELDFSHSAGNYPERVRDGYHTAAA